MVASRSTITEYGFYALRCLFPTLWQYLIVQYIRVFSLSLLGFLVILFSARLDDIAKFIAFGADTKTTILFILHQIPYILPIAIPVSSLIASIYLYQRLSTNNELTAMRASGISLVQALLPILLFTFFMGLFTFEFILDLGSLSHRNARELEYDIRSGNPLALLQQSPLLRYQGIDLDVKGTLQRGETCRDLLLTMRHGENRRCLIVLSKKIDITSNDMNMKNTSIITTVGSAQENEYDHLMIENIQNSSFPLSDLSHLIHRKPWKVVDDQLQLSMLFVRKRDLKERMEATRHPERKKHYKYYLRKCDSEIARRISLSLAIFTFALMGATFGMSIGRSAKAGRILQAIVLAAFLMACYMAAKTMTRKPLLAIALFFLPHLIIYWISYRRLTRLHHGIE